MSLLAFVAIPAEPSTSSRTDAAAKRPSSLRLLRSAISQTSNTSTYEIMMIAR